MKKKIIFVDDEEKILEGLKRSLWDIRDKWEMEFSLGGADALEAIKISNYDVIVTDMRMPGMNGLELLMEVKRLYPETVRIILSGYSDQDVIIKSIELTHRYLSKPCDVELLKSVINKAFELRSLLKNERLRKLISKIHTIPSVPKLYQRLLAEVSIKETSIDRIGELISSDIGMSAKMLQIVNSAFFGISRKIKDIREVVKLLGLDVIKSLVLSIDVFTKYDEKIVSDFSINELISHSLICAGFAKEIAIVEKLDKEIINNSYMAGMLHDLGRLIIVANLPEKYVEIVDMVKQDNLTFYEAEKKALNATHAELGGYLAKLWGLPDDIVEAITFHHTPSESGSDKISSLTCVHSANSIFYELFPDKNNYYKVFFDNDYLDKVNKLDRLSIWRDECFKKLNSGESNE